MQRSRLTTTRALLLLCSIGIALIVCIASILLINRVWHSNQAHYAFAASLKGRIVFSSLRNNNEDLFVLHADGSGVESLTNNAATNFRSLIDIRQSMFHANPSWSPDGQFIAFTVMPGSTDTEDVYRIRADGTNQVNLTNNASKGITAASSMHPAWSPDGQLIAFSYDCNDHTDAGIYVMNRDGTNARYLRTPGTWPAWSPDGTLIAFVAFDQSDASADIYVMNADGTNRRQLTRGIDVAAGRLAWSPNGQFIAFRAWNGSNGDLYIVPITGGKLRNLTNSAEDERSVVWSPDGRLLAYTLDSQGIYVIRPDGSYVYQLTDRAATDIDWVP